MIDKFRENEMRDSGLIFKSTFEQIKKIYSRGNKEQAGELAISAIELVLTGEISSDDFMIEVILEDMKVINEKNNVKRDKSIESKRRAKAEKENLYEIAEMLKAGLSQKKIADKLGVSQGTISKRISVIRNDYPEIFQIFQKFQHVNVNVNDNVNVDVDVDVSFVAEATKLPNSADAEGLAPVESANKLNF